MNPILLRRVAQHFQVVVAHLVAEPPRAAMDHHRDLTFGQSHHVGGFLVENLVHDLHFEKMISAAERTELAGKIDEDLLGRFERLFASKGDAAIVALEHEVCTGCHMKVTTQTAHRVKNGKEIVNCEQCGRILYAA